MGAIGKHYQQSFVKHCIGVVGVPRWTYFHIVTMVLLKPSSINIKLTGAEVPGALAFVCDCLPLASYCGCLILVSVKKSPPQGSLPCLRYLTQPSAYPALSSLLLSFTVFFIWAAFIFIFQLISSIILTPPYPLPSYYAPILKVTIMRTELISLVHC